MKIRNGFVSNSSSSSFIVAVAPGTDLKTELEKYRVDGENPFAAIGNEIIDWFIDIDLETVEEYYSCEKDEIEELGWEEFVSKPIAKAIADGWDVRTGAATDDYGGEGVEGTICNMSFDIEDEKLIIQKEGSY